MPEQVPGGKSRQEQLAQLLLMLTGHQKFGKHRGKLDISVADKLSSIATSDISWAQKKKQAQEIFGDWMVLLRIMAKLFEDGNTDAFDEFLKALRLPDYLLPGEIIPVDQTEPVTFILFDADEMLEFLKKVLQSPE